MINEITPQELKARRDAGTGPLVLDVREKWEVDVASIPDVRHIPMGEVSARLAELDPHQEIVVMCKSGGRSTKVAQFLVGKGFENVANLTGGILAWSRDVDPSVRGY